MARAPVKPIAVDEMLRPVASPVDTGFKAPALADNGAANLTSLAQGLSKFDKGLNTLLADRQAEQDKADAAQAEVDFHKNNQIGYAKAVETGAIPAFASKAYMNSWKQTEGRNFGTQLQEQFNNEYAQWGGKDSEDPKAFDTFLSGFLTKNLPAGTDPQTLEGLRPQLRGLVEQGTNRYVVDKNTAIKDKAERATVSSADIAVTESRKKGLDTGKVDFEEMYNNIEKVRADGLSKGMTEAALDPKIMDMVTTKAVEAGGADGRAILGFLDRKVPGKDYTYAQTPYGRESKVKALDAIDTNMRKSVAEGKALQKDKDAKEKSDLTRQVIESLIADPNKPVDDKIMQRGSVLDGDFRVSAMRWQETIRSNKASGNTKGLLDLNNAIINGEGMGAVKAAMDYGIITSREELVAAYNLVQAVEKNSPDVSEALKGQQVTELFNTIKGATAKKDNLTNPFAPVEPAGLQAQYDLRVGVMQWAQANPEAAKDPIKREEAIAKLGALILGRISRADGGVGASVYNRDGTVTGTAPNPYAPPVAPDIAPPLARGTPGQTLPAPPAPAAPVAPQAPAPAPVAPTPQAAPAAAPVAPSASAATPGAQTTGDAVVEALRSPADFMSWLRAGGSPPPAGQPTQGDALRKALGDIQSPGDFIRWMAGGGAPGAATPDSAPVAPSAPADPKAAQTWYDSLPVESRSAFAKAAANAKVPFDDYLKRTYERGLAGGSIAPAPVDATPAADLPAPGASPTSLSTPAAPEPAPRQGGYGPGNVYANLPVKDTRGEDQIQKFLEWNPDPVGNSDANLKAVKGPLQSVFRKAMDDNPDLRIIVGAGVRSMEDQKKAVKWGWSKTLDSHHADGSAMDVWVLDKNGRVTFDTKALDAAGAAVQKAAKELGVQVEWGGNFKSFKDRPHFELVDPNAKDPGYASKQAASGGATIQTAAYTAGPEDDKFAQATEETVQAVSKAIQDALSNPKFKPKGNYALSTITNDPLANRLADFVAGPESNGNYNAVWGKANSTTDLSKFSVDEILQRQKQTVAQGGQSATGRYQIIRKTMAGLKKDMGLTGTEMFTPELQDAMFVELAKRRGLEQFREGKLSMDQFSLNLAKEWASLPDPKTGRSVYAGDGLNKAHVTTGQVQAALLGNDTPRKKKS